MLKKLGLWFICFGLSFFVERLGWAEQGKAFLYINLGLTTLIIFVCILCCLFLADGTLEKIGISFVLIIVYAIITGIILLATWGATKIFNVDFYVTYQIMSLGNCFCSSNKKDE